MINRLRILLPALATVALPALPAPARAVQWLVPAQAPTIAAGLDSAAAGDTVTVACGSYAEFGLVLKTDVTLRSATGDPACVTLDGARNGRVMSASGVTGVRVEGFTIQQGDVPSGEDFLGAGGAIRCDSSEVALADCLFTGNAAVRGGAVGARATDLLVTDCTFLVNAANSATWSAGGGIYAQDCHGSILRCDFLSNLAAAGGVPADGGGVFLDECVLTVEDCRFDGNHAQAGAGGLYSYQRDNSTIRRCRFENNTAGGGGAMYFERSYARVEDCDFVDNDAESGGALFLDVSTATRLVRCTFDGNTASSFTGGVADCWRSTAVFEACRFTGNSAALRGGVAGWHEGAFMTLRDCVAIGNTCNGNGGVIWATSDAAGLVEGCTFAANTAFGSGGGLHLEGDATVTVEATVIAFSAAGAAVACTGNGAATLGCSNLYGNAGGDWVGCVAGQAGASGNLSADPLFCALGSGDDSVTLPDSPCLPANNPCGVRIGTGDGGCGCPAGATILVPSEQPTIAAALAAAVPGDVIGICDGTYTENVTLVNGVHLLGVRRDLAVVKPDGTGAPTAVLVADAITDSTVVAGLHLEGAGLVPQAVEVRAGSTGLHLARNAISGGTVCGVLNGFDSAVFLGDGTLATANDVYGNGGATPLQFRNDAPDSLDAFLNYWGTTAYDVILGQLDGPIRSCPITDITHTKILCAPLSALGAPPPSLPGPELHLTAGPNPFFTGADLRFTLPPDGRGGRLAIHDVLGRRVRTFALGPGAGTVRWAGTDDGGRNVAPGVYFVRLEAAGAVATRRLVRLR
ncbi:right-handed parallel beta-helix repeat-containing protein [bacterium]|nr:right-handed parallel beta-helix repeat-containing protein [bacterium]